MHITQIRIAGFKSFVDPTDVPVEEGLTGIVGPNGCGKSNLLEALRWAMGASSARAMRGAEMDDLIFSGSADRPARETAEVTLVLDNADRKAPPEFNSADTLEILRRLKRGVGSTYKLNGRTVRGKDIQLLFADASTGANSPALVRQGQISELIASKPQNRRRILEEAAGISGLNTRRHEAELKLRAAENNLERLSELSLEVERQLESLKRQARKARKYKALSEDIAGYEALAAHLRWEEAKTACDTADTALAETQSAVEALTLQDATCETARLKAGEALGPLREAESIASAKLGQARIALARLETERKAAIDAAERIAQELTRLSADLEREQAMITEASDARQRTEGELQNLPQEDPDANAEQETAVRAQLDAARDHVRMRQDGVDHISTELAELRAKRRAAHETAETQRRREAKLAAELKQLQAGLAAIEDADALYAKRKTAEHAEAEAELVLHDAERAAQQAEAALSTCEAEERAAKQPVADLEQAIRALEGEIAGLKRLLRRSEASKAPPVLDRVRTQDGYERAVAAALGDDLQAPIDTSAAIHWAGAEVHLSDLPDEVTPLNTVTDAPEELGARLSQCGVVTPDRGAELAKDLRPGQRLVSQDGHLWRWDGFVRTPDAPVSAAERLEQQARLEAAEAELAPLKAEFDEAKQVFADAKAETEQAKTFLREARDQIPQLSKTLNDNRRATIAAVQAFEHAAMKRESAETTLQRVAADHRAAQDAVALIAEAETDNEENILQNRLEALRAELAAAREAEGEARGQLTDFTRGREQAVARRESLQRDLAEWQRRENAATERRNALLLRREETAASLAASKDTHKDADDQALQAATARTETLESERKTIADQLANAETIARETETAARAANLAAARAREQLAAAKVTQDSAKQRFSECIEISRTQFQRLPEGLLPLAKTKLDEDAIAGLSQNEATQKADFLKRDRDQLGGVNMEAEEEADALSERLGTQASEKKDLVKAIAKLREGVDALNAEGRDRLMEAFEVVNGHFKALFTALFRGGQAELRLIDADDPLAAGLEIFAQPPGKRLGTLRLMSGGEQALTAAALIFAVFLSNPAPVCVLDEVDAPLDDANVDRFCRMLDEMRTRTDTRFLIITHNPVTMSRMDRLFGVTMREKGVSKLVSVDHNAAEDLVAAE